MITLTIPLVDGRGNRAPRIRLHCLLALILATVLSERVIAETDALVSPSLDSPLVTSSLLLDVTSAGSRLIAVGERGHILYSDDSGMNWRQAKVPVRVTLTGVDFPTEDRGWAVGHDGVVLFSNDGGETWVKQLDGNQLNLLVREDLQDLLDEVELDGSAGRIAISKDDLSFLVEESDRFLEEGPSRAFLDVSFRNANEGIVVGSYGLIMETRDGGTSWHSLIGKLDNPFGFHLYDIERVGNTVIVAGEAGSLHRLEEGDVVWTKLDAPYEGSFFGVIGDERSRFLIAYGLRGEAYLSQDMGKSWKKLDTGVDSTIEGGAILDNGVSVLVGHGGVILVNQGGDSRYVSHHLPKRNALSAVAKTGKSSFLVVGDGGVNRINKDNYTIKVDENEK